MFYKLDKRNSFQPRDIDDDGLSIQPNCRKLYDKRRIFSIDEVENNDSVDETIFISFNSGKSNCPINLQLCFGGK